MTFITICALLGLLSGIVPALASAALTRLPESFSPLDGSGSGVTFHEPQGIAIDEATGNVFVTDGPTPAHTNPQAILILGKEGAAPAGLASPFSITGLGYEENAANDSVLTYDNSASSPAHGTLYTYDPAVAKIKKYTRDAVSEHYVLAGEISTTGVNTGGPVGLTTDSSGNIYLGSFNAKSVFKFSSAGVQQQQYNLATPEANVGRPSQVAVDAAGDLFVQKAEGGVWKFPVNGVGEIEPAVFTQFITEAATGIAYDSANNHLLVAFRSGHVGEYDATSLAKLADFGTGVLTGSGATQRIAVNSATNRVYVVDASTKKVVVFGPPTPLPTVTATAATGVTGRKATLNGSVDPEGFAVSECFFEYGLTTSYGSTAPCEQTIPTDSETHFVSSDISGLTPNGKTYHYRLVAKGANGTERSGDATLVTAPTAVIEPATGISPTGATLNGTVRPEGLQFTACKFEYGLTTNASFENTVDCNPAAAAIPPDFAAHPVSFSATNLQQNRAYRFRLTVTNSEGTLTTAEATFDTSGSPQISQVLAFNAGQTSASLQAQINPRGFETHYFVEWGPTAAYGNRIPAGSFERPAGSGSPVSVTAELAGLSPGTVYHYRFVANSSAGTTASPDQELETLNSCGLPDGRCFELVSPRELGPVGAPGRFTTSAEINSQAAEASGGVAYAIENGLSDVTVGGLSLYRAARGTEGWSSSQLTPPLTVRNERSGGSALSSSTLRLSSDLSCGVVVSNQPLTSDPVSRPVVEGGGSNLYRRNANGSYTLITNVVPENLQAGKITFEQEYLLIGMSDNCDRVVFLTLYRYPGVSGTGTERLYEWHNGVLTGIGLAPSGGGVVPVQSTGGTIGNTLPNKTVDSLGAVSKDGSRIFYSATRQEPGHLGDAGEVGKVGVFARENGAVRDVSASATTTANTGAAFQGATPDGTHVYFTANSGLTANSSAEGTDLYEYNLVTSTLTDLSVDHEVGGAEVGGVLGFADNGSHVYFAARGQLVPGRGPTRAQNVSAETYSVYDAAGVVTRFVGTITNEDRRGAVVQTVGSSAGRQTDWTSRVSPDGRFLVFESATNLTGYESGGADEAYIYDAAANSEPTVCVSCRQDGKPSVTPSSQNVLQKPGNSNPLYATRSVIVRNGKPVVFFVSRDPLASGVTEEAIRERTMSLYEWTHNQVFHIATEPIGATLPNEGNQEVQFVGASSDGTDLYFFDPASLNWENPQGRNATWDARVGGGFLQPAGPPPACDPTSERERPCQGSSSQPAALPAPASSIFSGPGNVQPKPKKHKKKHHGKKHKKKHHGKNGRKSQGKQKARHANGNRRAGK